MSNIADDKEGSSNLISIKRKATDEEVIEICDKIKSAISVESIPELPSEYYFTRKQILGVITRVNNPFVVKLNRLIDNLTDDYHQACKIEQSL